MVSEKGLGLVDCNFCFFFSETDGGRDEPAGGDEVGFPFRLHGGEEEGHVVEVAFLVRGEVLQHAAGGVVEVEVVCADGGGAAVDGVAAAGVQEEAGRCAHEGVALWSGGYAGRLAGAEVGLWAGGFREQDEVGGVVEGGEAVGEVAESGAVGAVGEERVGEVEGRAAVDAGGGGAATWLGEIHVCGVRKLFRLYVLASCCNGGGEDRRMWL